MATEQQMKLAMQAYIDAFNRSDAAGIVALYADDATVEDPVGTPVMRGREAIAKFYAMGIATGAKLKLAAPIRGSHGDSAAMAFDVELKMPQAGADTVSCDSKRAREAPDWPAPAPASLRSGTVSRAALIRVIDVMTFDAAGRFASMRAFWGPGDMEILDG